jgi:hypothetical protein
MQHKLLPHQNKFYYYALVVGNVQGNETFIYFLANELLEKVNFPCLKYKIKTFILPLLQRSQLLREISTGGRLLLLLLMMMLFRYEMGMNSN